MKVKKYSGEIVEFDVNRLRDSLAKSGASTNVVNEVLASIKPLLFEGMSTRSIYQLAFRLLKKESDSFAARYSLKKALRDLGPAGYYFEKWVARLFEYAGFRTLTGQLLTGNAVNHEIDVIAQDDTQMLLIECKFRNTVDARISVTTPMYFLSRVKDLQNLEFTFFGRARRFTAGWLVTNAYMTTDSIKFAAHYHLNLLAWDYPAESSIKRRVDHAGLYPVTCLTTVTKAEKDKLLTQGCLLVKDILDDRTYLQSLNLTARKEKRIIQEAIELVNHQNN